MTSLGARPAGSTLAASFALLAGAVALAPSCAPIEVPDASSAPVNRCADHPCDDYKGDLRAPCGTDGRCQFINRPSFPFWLVVHVADTAIFAPGSTFAFYSDANGEPTFKPPTSLSVDAKCVPPFCVKLGNFGAVSGSYTVSEAASKEVGFPLAQGTSIPVRVVYVPTSNVQRLALAETLPVDVQFTSSRLGTSDERTGPNHRRVLPFGTYQRVMYPEAPYDEFFPPTSDTQIIGTDLIDDFLLLGVLEKSSTDSKNSKPLDPISDGSRLARVTRDDGLDGFRVWLEDASTRRRISVVRSLTGRDQEMQLFTTDENRSPNGTGLGNDVEAVVAPPDDWTAVPRYVTPLPGGAGLQNLQYPAIPPPVAVTGVVAFSQPGEGDVLRGIPSTLAFDSVDIASRAGTTTLLRYRTTVTTDDRGRFATILPPGTYFATITPKLGTGFATTRQKVVIDRTVTTVTLKPPSLAVVKGKVLLTDGRPVGDTEILATPDPPPSPATDVAPVPNPTRTRTARDGSYLLELDPGPWLITVIPAAGSGFPRVVVSATVPAQPDGAAGFADIRVPPPTPLKVTIKDPTLTVNPVVRAVVRVFAEPSSRKNRPIEIGVGMTDQEGTVEILLAEPPP